MVTDIQFSDQQIIRIHGFHLDVFDNSESVRPQQITTVLNDASNNPYPTILIGGHDSLRKADHTDDE